MPSRIQSCVCQQATYLFVGQRGGSKTSQQQYISGILRDKTPGRGIVVPWLGPRCRVAIRCWNRVFEIACSVFVGGRKPGFLAVVGLTRQDTGYQPRAGTFVIDPLLHTSRQTTNPHMLSTSRPAFLCTTARWWLNVDWQGWGQLSFRIRPSLAVCLQVAQ
jgi:hypothetical protein